MSITLSGVDNAWALLGAIVALGAITVAILHIVNELGPIRSIFHGYMIRGWIRERTREYWAMRKRGPSETLPDPQSQEEHERKAFDLLIAAATGGYGLAFLGLPTNQLVGQVNAAAQIVLDNPRDYYPLLCMLAQPALPTVRVFWGGSQDQLPEEKHLRDLWLICNFADRNALGDTTPTPDYLQARARIGHAIQRNLDGLQITLTNRGFQIVLILALAIGMVLACLLVRGQDFLETLLVGAAAGYIALVIGDVFAILRRLGQR